ncbi:sensor histidine kinase [Dactylosporangium sp. NPDC051541]|uniref:sensor histidine kinase n=1 Tax=Dactylosporangium sp. NPDC051541 TaxID=3363977 RepID=UPI0037B264F2
MLAVAAAIKPSWWWLVLGSLVVTAVYPIVYPDQPEAAGLWFMFEFTPLLVLLARLVRRGLWTGLIVGVAVVVLPLRMSFPLNGVVLTVASAFACAVGAAGVGLYLRGRDRALEAARRAQRLELARDLHDLVAHEVTGIVIEAQVPEAASYARIEAAGQRALAAMDEMVAALRSARVYGLADVPDLVGRFGSSASLSIAPGVSLSPAASAVAYHVVVEALTNVRRHASASARVFVALSTTGVISVISDLSDISVTRAHGGSGLLGLAERVAAVGGTLTYGPRDGRWEVVCDLSRSADVRGGGVQQP